MARILVIDDEIEILRIAETFLLRKGFEVMTAQDGEEGLRALDEAGPSIDLVVLDHRMPNLDGAGVLNEMRRKGIKKPVILLTGSIGKEIKYLKADATLLKPIDLDEMLEMIRKLVG